MNSPVFWRSLMVLVAFACDTSHAADFGTWMKDAGAFAIAPGEWDGRDWLEFGGTVAVIAAAHHYDKDVRAHFAPRPPADLETPPSHELRDALPGAALLAGSWVLSKWEDDPALNNAAWDMVEAAVLSSTATLVLRVGAGRERPYETRDPNAWFKGGSAFPSLHTTVAFAIGTVFAESGGDYYRLAKRVIGYGIAAGTGYLRVHDGAHWFSDAVAGAAVGEVTGRFITNRHGNARGAAQFTLVPERNGMSLQFVMALR